MISPSGTKIVKTKLENGELADFDFTYETLNGRGYSTYEIINGKGSYKCISFIDENGIEWDMSCVEKSTILSVARRAANGYK